MTGKRNRPNKNVRGTEADAERELARMLLTAGRLQASDMTLDEYVREVWVPALTVRRRTRDEYEAKMRLHVLPVLGATRLDRLEPYVLDRWVVGLPKTRTGLHAFRVLHAALSRAVRWRLIEVNPLDAVDPPRPQPTQTTVLTSDEALEYLDVFAGHELEPIVVLAIGCGLRRSELCALEWSDIDIKNATVSITKGMHERKGETWLEEPKSANSRRIVSLPAWVVDALKPHRGIGPITTRKPSQVSALYRRTIAAADRARKAADPTTGLRYVPIKQLRHTHATIALAAGVDVVAVSRRLGHSTVTVTDAFYLKPGRSADQVAAAAMDTWRAATGGNGTPAATGGNNA